MNAVSKTLFKILFLLSCFCSTLYAEEEIIYEYEEAAPIKKQIKHPNASQQAYGPMQVDQYEGDHSLWWYEKNQKKYQFYMGMTMPYNLPSDLNDLTLGSVDIPTDILDSNGDLIVAAGTIAIGEQTNLETTNGIGFTLKTGVEYRKFIRFDIEIGSKQLFLKSIDLINNTSTNASGTSITTSYDLTEADITLMYNYAGANLAFEWHRGLKAMSPFVGVGMGGGYFSTSGLGEDFTPYTQATLGFTYRFNKSIALEIFASSLIVSDDFNFTLEYGVDSITKNGTTYDNINANIDLNALYSNAVSGDYAINSIVIAYRFLF